jgi:hypothetical protein
MSASSAFDHWVQLVRREAWLRHGLTLGFDTTLLHSFYEAGADAGQAADRICATLRDHAGQSTGQHFVAPKDRGDLLGPRC